MKKFMLVCMTMALTAASPLWAQWVPIGTGSDVSYMVIESPHNSEFLSTPLQFAIYYTFDPIQEYDSYWLLQQVIAFDPLFDVTFVNYGTDEEPSYFITSMTYDSITLVTTSWPDVGPYWQQWAAGGESGYPAAEPISDTSWSFGSGMSFPYRLIAPGSTDGWVYATAATAPTIDPVPEPSASLLVVLAGAALWRVRRRITTA